MASSVVASGPDEQWLPWQKLQQQQPMEALVYEILSLPLYSIYIYICLFIFIYLRDPLWPYNK